MSKLRSIRALVLLLLIPGLARAGSYADVPRDHWAYDYIEQASAAGILKGAPRLTYASPQERPLDHVEIVPDEFRANRHDRNYPLAAPSPHRVRVNTQKIGDGGSRCESALASR